MRIRTRGVAALLAAVIGMASMVVPAGSAAAAYVFPSTNATNTANGFPHVTEVSKGIGTVTLQFVNPTNSLAAFEYRIDGQRRRHRPPPRRHRRRHPPHRLRRRTHHPRLPTRPVTQTFTANSTVEIRLALGGERDWDFDWTPFTVGEDYVFPSTNAINTANGFPHVTEVSKGIGTVTLQFVNPTNSLAAFEYRIDGNSSTTAPTPSSPATSSTTPSASTDAPTRLRHQPRPPEPSPPTALVEIRLALGGERDWDFDWTPFTVGRPTCSRAPTPSTPPTDSPTSPKSPKASAPSPSNSSTPPTHSPNSNTASTDNSSTTAPTPSSSATSSTTPSASTDAPPPSAHPDPSPQTFTANSTVEIRLALGGERDWDFDWTPFTVGQPEVPTSDSTVEKPTGPTSKDDCKRGGWKAFEFRNQGQCIKFVKNADRRVARRP